MDGRRSRIRYFVPSSRAVRRLRAYGVLAEHITLTGFPLPEELVGGPDASLAREHLARSLVRLDPCRRFRALHGPDVERTVGPLPSEEEGKPPRLVFAVGGAGAQAEFALDFLPSLRDPIRSGRIELTLVAGTRPDVANVFERALTQAGLSGAVPVLLGANFGEYYRRFNALLASTDILWTKPSELSFYAGLGAALVLAPPVGSHERYNQLWLREQGAALSQDSAAHAAAWLGEWFEDGTLAAAAWTAFVRLPKDGARRIARAVTSELRDDDVPAAGSHRAQS